MSGIQIHTVVWSENGKKYVIYEQPLTINNECVWGQVVLVLGGQRHQHLAQEVHLGRVLLQDILIRASKIVSGKELSINDVSQNLDNFDPYLPLSVMHFEIENA